ncbi:MAG: thiol reductase thioredoxin [Phycisphaerae bacterium]|nr:thiol reductase thioredoxin [Phycisphaerae bacterium]
MIRSAHEAGLGYEDYLQTDPGKADAWREVRQQLELNQAQLDLLGGFTRTIKAICISGIWCGDCSSQGPMIQAIADATDCIDLAWLDRDEYPELASRVMINKGMRVPVLILAAEDHELVSVFGDRTLNRYRAMAESRLGPACPVPGASIPRDQLHANMQDFLDEFERVHLLLRLSTRLRMIHGD